MPSKPQIQFRASELREGLEARTHPEETASMAARMIVGQYLRLMDALDNAATTRNQAAIIEDFWNEDNGWRGTVAEAKRTT